MYYPLSNFELQQLLKDEQAEGLFVGVFSYETLPNLHYEQFCIANTDNIYPSGWTLSRVGNAGLPRAAVPVGC